MKSFDHYRMKLVFAGFTTVIVLGNIKLANGTTINVGPWEGCDYSTIQAGIDAASDGDTVIVAPGEYVITVPITFRGKPITVRSETGPDETIIRMATPTDTSRSSVVIFEDNETAESILEGFTITGGRGTRPSSANIWSGGGIFFDTCSGTVRNCTIVQNMADYAGGIFCRHLCSPMLIDCIIEENSARDSGGGVFFWDEASLTLISCIIRSNSAEDFGGGLSCYFNSSATLTDCIISGNSVTGSTALIAGYGGGVSCTDNSLLTLTNCTITENSAGFSAGGIMCYKSSTTLNNCVISKNLAARLGGAIFCETDSSMTMANCIISGNSAKQRGGGVECYLNSSVNITNCTIWGNSAAQSGGGVDCFNGCSVAVTNSIVSKNTSLQGPQISVRNPSTTVTIAYSNVSNGQAEVYVESGCILDWNIGNIDADPYFSGPGYWADFNDPNIIVEPDDLNAVWIDGDYHLKSELGRWDPVSVSWVTDDVTSPCIDRGDPNHPVGEEPDPNGGIINMGAYGGTPEASMSIGQLPPLPPPKPLAHWKLDETEGNIAHDDTGRYHSSLNGNPVWQTTEGKIDGALAFDGVDDYVSTPFILNARYTTLSVFAWIKGGEPGQMIISQTNGTGFGATWLCADTQGGTLMTSLMDPQPVLVSESVITDGQWHHIGLVWDGSIRCLYVDGAEVAKDISVLSYAVPCDGGLHIGAGKELNTGTFFSGLIDDIHIYGVALSAEEVASLAQ